MERLIVYTRGERWRLITVTMHQTPGWWNACVEHHTYSQLPVLTARLAASTNPTTLCGVCWPCREGKTTHF